MHILTIQNKNHTSKQQKITKGDTVMGVTAKKHHPIKISSNILNIIQCPIMQHQYCLNLIVRVC